MSDDIFNEVKAEIARAKEKWTDMDKWNTSDDYILYSLAYIGRATKAARNKEFDRKEMLVKAIGLLVNAIESEK